MPNAGVTRSPPTRIAAATATTRQRGTARCGVRCPAPAAVEHVIPVGVDNRDREDPFERIRDFQLNVCHRTASSYERRSAECAVASVAETVPTSTSRAVAIDR